MPGRCAAHGIRSPSPCSSRSSLTRARAARSWLTGLLGTGADMAELAEWESFYVIVGSAAGALIGLQFVVMTLLAENPPQRVAEAGAAFASPTIVHFSAALLLSALL